LFTDDSLNLRIALTTKLLNKNVQMAVKSTTKSHTVDLRDVGVEIVENPFEIIANQIEMSLTNSHLLVLQNWIYGIGHLKTKNSPLPKGKYIICGFGRMGQVLFDIFEENDIDAVFIEPDRKALRGLPAHIKEKIIIGSADNKELLVKSGIHEAVAIIAGTANDTQNLSILTSARRVNPQLFTIARENEMTDLSVFKNANINMVFIPGRLLIHKTTNALIASYSSKFLHLMTKRNDKEFTKQLIIRLKKEIGYNPSTFGITINEDKAYAIYKAITEDNLRVTIEILKKSRIDYTKDNKIIPLILIRGQEKILLPSCSEVLELDDKILFASNAESMNDALYIAQNIYEFHYAYRGVEKDFFGKYIKGIIK
jgi:Trk K+ transport system NAD-binding subunit